MSKETNEKSNRRSTPLLLTGGAIAAAVLVLGINGTMSSWSSAIITNSTNTARAAEAVALSESNATDGVCANTLTSTDNTATCSTINKYGGTATPLEPGGQQTATVTMTNTGTSAGNLTLLAGACSKSGGGATSDSLCDHLLLSLECPPGTAIGANATLSSWASGSRTVGSLAAGASIDCTFTVTMSDTAPTSVAGQQASQPLIWTLTAA